MKTMIRQYPILFYSKNFIKSRWKYLITSALLVFLIEYFGLHLHLFEVSYDKFTYPLEVQMDEYINSIKSGKDTPIKPINKYEYKFVLQNNRKCRVEDSEQFEKIVILYVIKSALNHRHRRDIIRKTWGWEKRFSDVLIRRVFVLGISKDVPLQATINEESVINKDIVQADFFDSYYNNTVKTLMGFRWVVQNCPKAQFVMFADDDMYVSTKNLLKFIRNPFNKRVGFRKRRTVENLLKTNKVSNKLNSVYDKNATGYLNVTSRKLTYDPVLSAFDGRLFAGYVFDSPPMRHKSSKWYITLDEYPFSRYPPYVTAGAFVLSYPALEDMYCASLFTKHFRFDDIYLGILAKKCGISPLHNQNFYFWKKSYSGEDYANVIASHGYDNPEELKKVWEEQRSFGHA